MESTAANEPSAAPPSWPVADRRPVTRTHHGDTFEDPYEWLRDKHDPDVIGYLEAENAYTASQTDRLEPLTEAVFNEIKARTQETDLSVPHYRAHEGGSAYWYYTPHRRGVGVLHPLPGRRSGSPPPAGSGGGRRGRAGAAGRQPGGGRPRLLRDRRPRRLGGRAAAGLLHRHHRRRALHAAGEGPGHGGAAARRDRRHGVRRGLGPQQPPLLHPGRRRVAALRGAPAPAGHRPGWRRRGADRAGRAVLARRGLQSRRQLDRAQRRQQGHLGVPAAPRPTTRRAHRASSLRAARVWSTTSRWPGTGC